MVFFTTFLLSSPVIYLGYSDSENVIKNEACNLYNNRYKLFGSIFCFLIPLTIMIVMYYHTVKRLKQFHRAFENFKEKSTKHTMKRSSFKASSFLMKNKRNNLKKCVSPAACIELNVKVSKKSQIEIKKRLELLKSNEGLVKKSNKATRFLNSSFIQKYSPKLNRFKTEDAELKIKSAINNNSRNKFKTLVNKTIIRNNAINAFRINKETAAIRNEQKAVKVLGIVFVIFLVAWAPFALFNILSAVCESCEINMEFLGILSWLGYFSSAINPIVYNAFNEKFRNAFKQILKCNISSFKRVNIYSYRPRILNNPSETNSRTGPATNSRHELRKSFMANV